MVMFKYRRTAYWTLGVAGVSIAGIYGLRKLKAFLEERQREIIDSAINAAREGKAKDVMRLIKKAGSPDVTDEEGSSCLMHAVECGQITVVRLLLDVCGANPNFNLGPKATTPLHIAAANNKIECIEILVEQQISLDPLTEDGSTPLHYAAMYGHYEATMGLIRAGCSLEQKRHEDGATALILAANGNHADVAKLLIEAGADVSSRLHGSDATALIVAAKKDNMEVANILLEQGGDVNESDSYGRTALMIAAKNNSFRTVSFLISEGADLQHFSRDGKWSALHLACKHGHVRVVCELLKHEVEIGCKNSLGRTPLSLAAAAGARSVVRELVLAGADVNDVQEEDATVPLSVAAAGGHEGVVHDLLVYGASPNGPTEQIEGDGCEQISSLILPLHCAVTYKHPQIVRTLVEHGASPTLRCVSYPLRRPSNAVE
eukprot:gb/GECG01004610.1/.p1 GENE.gb/GECG01004610.1/~~gb/GECG01004610.1/.p1  ORF type:complete len:432 (+),score=33.41 gb/GECG01004610.1/:1-1296(+)